MLSTADREGRPISQEDVGNGIGALLTAAWQLAKANCSDEAQARALYVRLLRRHADGAEGL